MIGSNHLFTGRGANSREGKEGGGRGVSFKARPLNSTCFFLLGKRDLDHWD